MNLHGYEYDVMEWDDIRKLVPKEAAVLEERLQALGMSTDELCAAAECDAFFGVQSLSGVWHRLSEAFTQATTVEGRGLTLEPRRLETYDGYTVHLFHLQGMSQLTPAGEKYLDKIEVKELVVFE